METERYREILRKELKQTDAAMKRQALQKLKEEGKVRFVGMTGYPLAVQQEIITRSGVGIDTSLSCAAQFGRAIRRNSARESRCSATA